jgi:hypothetical protein
VIDAGNTPLGNSESGAFSLFVPWLRPNLRLLADVAYSSVNVCVCPWRRPDLTVAAAGSVAEAYRRKRFNQRLSSCRVRVEHQFSRLKHTFRILQSQWNLPLDQLPRCFFACVLLCNWLARTRNLYTEDEED